MEVPLEMEVEEARVWVDELGGPTRRLVDCREEDEWSLCRIEGAEWIPLSRFAELAPVKLGDQAAEIVVYCHHGVRSMHATQWLRREGYDKTRSLRGGIDRWADLVDPEMRRY